MKRITCDTCKKHLEEGECIELGTEDGKTLKYENRLPDSKKVGETISISRYRDLHFCSKQHFIDYFFSPTP